MSQMSRNIKRAEAIGVRAVFAALGLPPNPPAERRLARDLEKAPGCTGVKCDDCGDKMRDEGSRLECIGCGAVVPIPSDDYDLLSDLERRNGGVL